MWKRTQCESNIDERKVATKNIYIYMYVCVCIAFMIVLFLYIGLVDLSRRR